MAHMRITWFGVSGRIGFAVNQSTGMILGTSCVAEAPKVAKPHKCLMPQLWKPSCHFKIHSPNS